jgi:hypothetical protein
MDKVQNNILNLYFTLLSKDILHSAAVLHISFMKNWMLLWPERCIKQAQIGRWSKRIDGEHSFTTPNPIIQKKKYPICQLWQVIALFKTFSVCTVYFTTQFCTTTVNSKTWTNKIFSNNYFSFTVSSIASSYRYRN